MNKKTESRLLEKIYLTGRLEHRVSPALYYFGQEQEGSSTVLVTLRENRVQ